MSIILSGTCEDLRRYYSPVGLTSKRTPQFNGCWTTWLAMRFWSETKLRIQKIGVSTKQNEHIRKVIQYDSQGKNCLYTFILFKLSFVVLITSKFAFLVAISCKQYWYINKWVCHLNICLKIYIHRSENYPF